MDKVNGSFIVGFDFTNGEDRGVLIVGKKEIDKQIEIINTFKDEQAWELYLKLTTKKEKE